MTRSRNRILTLDSPRLADPQPVELRLCLFEKLRILLESPYDPIHEGLAVSRRRKVLREAKADVFLDAVNSTYPQDMARINDASRA